VTGASSGIGRACALALGKAGACVALIGRDQQTLECVASEIEATGGTPFVLPADVTDEVAVEQVVAKTQDHGHPSICVNAAGINRTGSTADYSMLDFDLVLNTNLRGTFLVCRAVGRAMLADGRGGRIVNLSSQMGAVGYPGRAAYCASKHAVNGLTKALAVEWADSGISVNAVAPTFIRTPMTIDMLESEDFKRDVLRRIPMGRIGDIEDVVRAVLFLSSPANRLITGHVLHVDGGWAAW
jgi:NAD(P)-dependent dehydrogenase (short-subunit alcohol dehydrogenase family)